MWRRFPELWFALLSSRGQLGLFWSSHWHRHFHIWSVNCSWDDLRKVPTFLRISFYTPSIRFCPSRSSPSHRVWRCLSQRGLIVNKKRLIVEKKPTDGGSFSALMTGEVVSRHLFLEPDMTPSDRNIAISLRFFIIVLEIIINQFI